MYIHSQNGSAYIIRCVIDRFIRFRSSLPHTAEFEALARMPFTSSILCGLQFKQIYDEIAATDLCVRK